jgi:hypothetical protein
MKTLFRIPQAVVLIVILSALLVPGVHADSSVVADIAPKAQALTLNAGTIDSVTNSFTVTGTGFTPGGRVTIVLHDQWGILRYAYHTTVASEATYGANGSLDPANGYSAGGLINDVFDFQCGSELLVQARDNLTGSWSSAVEVDRKQCIIE